MDKKLKKLVEEAIKGDRSAFEELIVLKRRDVLYTVSRFCSQQEVEDFAQEALVLMYRKLGQLKDPEHFNEWMYSLIRNVCYQGKRKMLKRNKIAQIISFDPHSDSLLNRVEENRQEFLPVELIEHEEQRAEVMQEIQSLPWKYQECLLMYYYQELTYDEMAEIMGTSKKNIANYLVRGRKSLKKRLEQKLKQDMIISVAPVGVIPVLSMLYRQDAAATISEEMCARLSDQALRDMLRTGVSSGIGTAASKAGVASKLMIGVVSTVSVAGIAIGTVMMKPEGVTPGGKTVSATTANHAIEILNDAKQSLMEIEKPIRTLADMIGTENEALLLGYEADQVTEDEWLDFIQTIQAEDTTQTSSETEQYVLYVLEKQDKQLLLITKKQQGESKLQVIHRFGEIKEIPHMFDFILAF